MSVNRKTAALFALFVSLSLVVPAPGTDQGPEVERTGDVATAVIEGCRVISEADVRRAVATDSAIAVASSPSAPLTEYLNTVQRQVLAGYVGAGFVQAKVKADVEPGGGRLRIRVEEGPRYVWGKMRVIGNKLTDEAKLRTALAEWIDAQALPATLDEVAGTLTVNTYKPRNAMQGPEPPAFVSGEPAKLDLRWAKALVLRELFAQGLCWADPALETELHDDGTADLVINLSKEGPKARLRQARITGASINKPEEILSFLGIHDGMAIDLNTMLATRQKLWDSGRFLRHELRADIARGHPGAVDLTIEVIEHPKAPPLAQPLSAELTPAERATLQLGSTIANLAADKKDYVGELVLYGQRFHLIFSPGNGIALSYRRAADAPAKPEDPPDAPGPSPDLVIVVTSTQFGMYSEAAGRKFVAPPFRYTPTFVVEVIPDNDLKKWGSRMNVGVGLYSRSDPAAGAEPIRLFAAAAPVCFFDLVRPRNGKPDEPRRKAEIRDGVATLTFGGFTVHINAGTGDLIDLSAEDNANGQSIRLTREAGALGRELARLDRGGKLTNDYDPAHVATSCACFFVAVQDALPGAGTTPLKWDKPATALVLKFLAGQALQSLDESWNSVNVPTVALTLPFDAGSVGGSGMLALARGLLGQIDELFPYGSWPWTLGHEGLLVGTGGSPNAVNELRRLMSDGDMGPVGCLAFATALNYVDADRARSIARIGLSRLSAKDFERDLTVLLGNDRPGAKVLRTLLQSVGELSDDDAMQLARFLPTGGDQAIAYVRATARAQPGARAAELLRQHAGAWWEHGVRQAMEDALRRIAEAK